MLCSKVMRMYKGRIVPLSEEVINSIFQKFGVDKQKGDYTMDEKNGIRFIEIDKLQPHPRNVEIYGEENVSDLVAQIEAYGGIADPIKIKEDNTIISGHRRWQAARELGMTEVPCQKILLREWLMDETFLSLPGSSLE